MKKLVLVWCMVWLAGSAFGIERPVLEQRAQKLIAEFDAMQQRPDKRVPAELLQKAHGIILLDRTKAGFVFAYQGGSGLAMVKDNHGRWSPLAFMKANEASLGFQIGGQQSFIVILLMTDETTKSLIADAAFEFGGEARGTAGDTSSGVEGKVDSLERAVVIFDSRQGLFGGAAIKGGALSPDHDGNRIYYGGAFSMQDILFDKKLKPTAPAQLLASKLESYSKSDK